MSRVDFLNAKTSIQFTTQHIETVIFDLAVETHKELACEQALGRLSGGSRGALGGLSGGSRGRCSGGVEK